MSTKRPTSNHERAKQYIDEIIEITREFGMDGELPAERYKQAVDEAAKAFKGLNAASPASQ